VRTRDLYKFVDGRVVEWERREVFRHSITSKRIVEEARRLAALDKTDIDLTDLTPDTVIVDHSMIHYGMKEKNPLDFVKFYSKRNFNSESLFLATSRLLTVSSAECASAQKGDYSMLMPPIFAEVNLSIFTKHPKCAAELIV
jgi:hypothetical protein